MFLFSTVKVKRQTIGSKSKSIEVFIWPTVHNCAASCHLQNSIQQEIIIRTVFVLIIIIIAAWISQRIKIYRCAQSWRCNPIWRFIHESRWWRYETHIEPSTEKKSGKKMKIVWLRLIESRKKEICRVTFGFIRMLNAGMRNCDIVHEKMRTKNSPPMRVIRTSEIVEEKMWKNEITTAYANHALTRRY